MLLFDPAASTSDLVAVLNSISGGYDLGHRTIDSRVWGSSNLVSRAGSTANTIPKWSGVSAGNYTLTNSAITDNGTTVSVVAKLTVASATTGSAVASIQCSTADTTSGEQNLHIFGSNSNNVPGYLTFRSPGLILQNTSNADNTYSGVMFLHGTGGFSMGAILGVCKTQATNTGNLVFLTRATTASGSVEVARMDENGQLSLPVNSTSAGLKIGSDILFYRQSANIAYLDSDIRVNPLALGTNNYGITVLKQYTVDRAGEKAGITVNPTYNVASSAANDIQQGLRVNASWNYTTTNPSTAGGMVSYLQFNGSGGQTSVNAFYSAGAVNTGFTVPLLRHFLAIGFSGAGTITDHRGLDVTDLAGSNVYGVRIGVTAGANRYSIYTEAAQCYFGGTASATQLISRIATGTPPLSVASATLVPNLNCAYLNNLTWNTVMSISGGYFSGGTVYDSVDARWEHLNASGYAFTLRHGDAEGVSVGEGGRLSVLFGASASTGVGSTIGGITYFHFDKNGKFTAPVLVSNVATGTAPLTVTSTTMVSNLNVQYLNGQAGSYYAAASSLASYLPLAGGTVSGDIFFTGGHKYWNASNDGASSGLDADLLDGQQGSYYTNANNQFLPTSVILNGTVGPGVQSLAAHALGTIGDAFAFRSISNVEYWDGSAWTATAAINPQLLLTGKVGYGQLTVTPTYRSFRFVVSASSYLGPIMLAVHQTWNQGAHRIEVTLERGPTATGAWTTMIPATLSNADENNYSFFVTSTVGQGADTFYRVTITSQDTVNSTTYVGLQLLFAYTRSTDIPGGPALPMTWNSSRVASFINTPLVGSSTMWHSGNDGSGSGLDADMLDGYHSGDFAAYGHTHSGVYEPVFSKGNIIQGTGVTLSGTLTGRLVGSGDITINASTGVTDHGALTGLADDDHSQYHNDTRGDARYLKLAGGTVTGAAIFSNAEIRLRAAPAGEIVPYVLVTLVDPETTAQVVHNRTLADFKSDLGSMTPASHTHGNITNAGAIGSTANLPVITTTSGVLTVGSFGSGANTFCQGNDSRLSDARTPLSHSHGNITNGGFLGVTSGIPLITGTSGIIQAGSFGTGAGTFCQGNDSRLSDSRNPLSHSHGNIGNGGAIGVTANLPIITSTSGVLVAGSFGTGANTFCQGNDSRLSDARTPLSHSHGNIGNGGAIGVTANLPIITSTSGVLVAGSFGSSANTFCQGNDSRLSDSRTPTSHKTSHETGGGDALTGSLDANARVGVRLNSGTTYTRRRINFINGGGITISVVDDAGSEEIDVTISVP